MTHDDLADFIAAQTQELRRGTIVLASLSLLRTPHYGYALISALANAGFAVEQNTLYPLLRRLEKQGLLAAEWDTSEARPRKYYRTTEQGGRLASALTAEWQTIAEGLHTLAHPQENSHAQR
ncbi:PadR family transcriptional regulator [Micrococcales bacterium 31B]|nr:PadR family transcriptional regulator [Micrococcales bacterium 31B]